MLFSTPPELRDPRGQRLYLNRPEQVRLERVACALPEHKRLFLDILQLAGPRISEALELERGRVDLEAGTLVFRTLKRGGRKTYRQHAVPGHLHDVDVGALAAEMGVSAPLGDLQLTMRVRGLQPERILWREVPIPRALLRRLDRFFAIKAARGSDAGRLFPYGRSTVSRWVASIMAAADIVGPQACAKGLRHTFGVNHALAGTQQAVLQRLMGHANPIMTARYMQVVDDELRAIVRRTWGELQQ